MVLYKVLEENGEPMHGGTGRWFLPAGKLPGKWMPAVKVDPCRSGYHLCDGIGDLLHWLGPVIYEAEGRGENTRHDNKVVFAEARLLRRVTTWNATTARLFAADCAERVLPIYERHYPDDDRPRRAVEATRALVRGEIDESAWDAAWAAARAAARDAALAAAGAAARAAAWDAARDAARAAARAAAWAAAGAAARAAARDAALAAAGAAERQWQTDRLAQYLDGRLP